MRGQGLLPRRIEGVRSPSLACRETLRLCRSERDAVLASVALSKLTYAEIGARCGVTKQAVEKWTRKGIPSARVMAFCNATGTRLVEQYIELERALRVADGRMRELDYIAAIVRAA
ncbi:MAG TPA: hypothetical protein VGE09_08760 [Pseudoxanthomonas sp.]